MLLHHVCLPPDSSDPSGSSDAGTTLPQSATTADHVSSQPTPTSAPQTGSSPAANTPEPEPIGQAEAQPDDDVFDQAQNADPTVASPDKPEVTTSYPPVASTVPKEASSTALENASTLDLTPIPEATTSNPRPDDAQNDAEGVTTGPPSPLADLEDPSISVSPAEPGDLSELDALTTHIPTSTDAEQGDTTDGVTPGGTTADPLNVNPDPTKPATIEATSKPQNKPDPYKPSPAKPSSKPETKPLDVALTTLNIDDPRNYQAGKIGSYNRSRFSTQHHNKTNCLKDEFCDFEGFPCEYCNFI